MSKDFIRGLYVVFDKVAGEVASPIIFSSNDDSASRAFVGLVDGNKQYQPNGDFQLLSVGSIDMTSGSVTSCNPKIVIDGNDVSRETKSI